MRKYGFHDWNSCLATVGHGGLKEGQIVNRMYEEYKKDHLARITDEEVLETISENKEKVPEKKSPRFLHFGARYGIFLYR